LGQSLEWPDDSAFQPGHRTAAGGPRCKTGLAEGLLEDAIPYLEELAGVREKPDSRYDELKKRACAAHPRRSGGSLFPRQERRRAARAEARLISGYAFHPQARHELEEIWDFIRA
jgi:hypothetical protein